LTSYEFALAVVGSVESPSRIILFRVGAFLLGLESPSPGELASLTVVNNILDLDMYVLYGS